MIAYAMDAYQVVWLALTALVVGMVIGTHLGVASERWEQEARRRREETDAILDRIEERLRRRP